MGTELKKTNKGRKSLDGMELLKLKEHLVSGLIDRIREQRREEKKEETKVNKNKTSPEGTLEINTRN